MISDGSVRDAPSKELAIRIQITQEFGEAHLKHLGHPPESAQLDVNPTPLKQADVGSMETAFVGKSFLGKAFVDTNLPYPKPKPLLKIPLHSAIVAVMLYERLQNLF
jgi:hypothetical protein